MAVAAIEELRRLVHLSGRYLDDRNFTAFVDLLAEDGLYQVEVKAPELPGPMSWMLLTRDEVRERFEAAPRHEWRLPEQTRLISVDSIDCRDDAAETSATVSIFQTDDDGRTTCFAVGRYDDLWRRNDGRWRLARRVMRLRTRLLAVPYPTPI